MKTITFVGLGYIGLPTAIISAAAGNKVYGYDINKTLIDSLGKGKLSLYEPGLEDLFKIALGNKTFNPISEILESDIYVIAVPTPHKLVNGKNTFDDTFVMNAFNSIIPFLKDGNLVILESTSAIGTTEKLEATYLKFASKANVHFAYCPERVIPGSAIEEIINNDRVIGGTTPASTQMAIDFYASFVKGSLIGTNSRTAEMSKLAENSYRDVNIAYANQLSMLCDELDVNVYELVSLCNRHPRVSILNPGPGVGGHCIAVDPWFLIEASELNTTLILESRRINTAKEQWVVNKIIEATKNNIAAAKQIYLYGLTFKPNIDDFRESPSIRIYEALCQNNFTPISIDPFYNGDSFNIQDFKDCISKDGVHVFLVKHQFFVDNITTISNRSNLLDFCNLMSQI